MQGKLIIEGNAVYELDEDCLCLKNKKNDTSKQEEGEKKQNKTKRGCKKTPQR